MRITEVTREDGLALAQLLNVINIAKYDGLTGKDIEAFSKARGWLHSVALQAAEQLKSKATPTPVPQQGFKVKAMGHIGSPTQKRKQKHKK